jgi:uncharacterized protein YcbK (DUF882 family)
MGDLSRDFSRSEFVCHHCGLLPHLNHELLEVLQHMRTRKKLPLRIVSGYRCVAHNAAVGGSPRSQHCVARAADVPGGYATTQEWYYAGAVGIGVRDGQVVHVDTRPGVKPFTFDD